MVNGKKRNGNGKTLTKTKQKNAPVAKANTVGGFNSLNRTYDTKKRYVGRDLVKLLNVTTNPVTGEHLLVIDVNPHSFEGTKLSVDAKLFERYWFNSFNIVYVPAVPTTASGTVGIAYDRDVGDLPPVEDESGVIEMFAWPGTVASNVWNGVTLKFKSTQHHEALWTAANGEDDRFTSQGTVIVFCGNAISVNGALGSIFIEYDVEFSQPQLGGDEMGMTYHGEGLEGEAYNNGLADWIPSAIDMLVSGLTGKPISSGGDNKLLKTPNGQFGWFLEKGFHVLVRAVVNGTVSPGELVPCLIQDIGEVASEYVNLYNVVSKSPSAPQNKYEVVKVKGKGAYVTCPSNTAALAENGVGAGFKAVRINILSGKKALAYVSRNNEKTLISEPDQIHSLVYEGLIGSEPETEPTSVLHGWILSGTITGTNALGITVPCAIFQAVVSDYESIQEVVVDGVTMWYMYGVDFEASLGIADPHTAGEEGVHPGIIDDVIFSNCVVLVHSYA